MPELSFDWDESKRFKNIEKHGIDRGWAVSAGTGL